MQKNMENTKEKAYAEALEWWASLDTQEIFKLLKKYGYQDEKKPWKYRPLSDKGRHLIWLRETRNQNGENE